MDRATAITSIFCTVSCAISFAFAAKYIGNALRTPATHKANLICYFNPKSGAEGTWNGETHSFERQIYDCNELLKDFYDSIGHDNSDVTFRMEPIPDLNPSPRLESAPAHAK